MRIYDAYNKEKKQHLSPVRRSRAFEDEYWSTDNIHEGVDPGIISLDDDSDDDEEGLFLGGDED